jgi:hypothetical protein
MVRNALIVTSIVILGFALSCSSMAIAENYKLVPNTTQEKPTLLADGSPAVMVRFLIAPESATAAPRLDVTLVYDSKFKRAWWTYQRAQQGSSGVDLTRPWVVARAQDGASLVGFLLLGTQLIVRPSTASAGSVSPAQSAAIENLSSLSRAIQDGSDQVGTEISLVPPLSRDFFYQPFDASPISKAKIQRVSTTDTGWQIELEGVNSQSSVVRLSRDFVLLSATTRQ